MDKQWARDRLNEYLQAIRYYQAAIDAGRGFNQEAYEKVMTYEPTAKAIIRRVHPEFTDYNFLVMGKHMDALSYTIQTLTLLDRQDEIDENLGTSPRLSASKLHPWVWDSAVSLWETQHYREAVQAAATSVNAHLQQLADRRDVSDYKLITELFSEKSPETKKPRLRWPGEPLDEEFRSMQAGIRSFGAGIFQCIRNQATHDLTDLSEHEALERLAAISLFCRWIELCALDTTNT